MSTGGNPPPDVHGFGRVRFLYHDASVRESSWSIYWLVLKRNSLFWYLNERHVQAEGNCYIVGRAELSDERLETGEAVLQIKIETYKGLAIMQLALSQQNIGLWQKALHDHISELGATLPASYCFYEKQDVADDHHFAAIVEVEYDNKRFSIPMHIGDDADDIVTHFLEEHALNSDLHSSITAQVFKVQKELFLDMYVEHRRLNMNLIMKTQDLILSETRADMAEKHADEISQSLANLQHTVPALVSFTKTKEAEVASQAAKIDQQKDELNEEKRTVNILYEENERLRNMLTATGVTLKPQNDDGSLIEREPRTTSVATAASSSELVSENKRLREQTVRMRREILQLNAKVKDIQAAALLAFEHFNVDTIEKTSSAGMSEYKDTAASSSGATAAAAAKPIRDSSGPSPAGDSTTLSNIRRNVAIASTSADTGASTQAAGTKRIDLHPHMADFSKSTLSVMSAVNSPIVEDRLVRALFNRYADPGDHTLTMSRFLRCAKESGITSGGTGPSAAHAILASPASDLVSSALGLPRGVAFEPPFLEYGEVSMIFTNAVKNDALLLSSTHTIAVALNTDDYSTNIKKDRDAFNVRSFSNDYRRNSPNRQKPKLAVLMNLPQFVAALEQISVKLFSGLIEQQTGTIAECLPGHQKVAAMRAAFEVLLKRKIIPSVTSFGLMPWGLMSVECALASIESCFPNSSTSITTPLGETLAQHAGRIVSWHLAYSAQAMASAGQLHSIAKMESKLAMGTDLVGITYAEISRFCHEHAVVPYLLKEPQLLSIFREVYEWTLHRSFKAGDDQLATDVLSADIVANLIRAMAAETAAYTSRRVQQKQQQQQQQVRLVADTSANNYLDTPLLLKGGELARMKLNLTSFIVMLCAVAMQAFPDEKMESRMHTIVEWIRQNEPDRI